MNEDEKWEFFNYRFPCTCILKAVCTCYSRLFIEALVINVNTAVIRYTCHNRKTMKMYENKIVKVITTAQTWRVPVRQVLTR